MQFCCWWKQQSSADSRRVITVHQQHRHLCRRSSRSQHMDKWQTLTWSRLRSCLVMCHLATTLVRVKQLPIRVCECYSYLYGSAFFSCVAIQSIEHKVGVGTELLPSPSVSWSVCVCLESVLWQNGWLDLIAISGGEWSRPMDGCIRWEWRSSKGNGQFCG